mmetsp:Transcript_7786/g.19281  ORF Transcript_7786/g.19281 Transcript_7786/m.19281 type:complete len:210 (+) Transcript_7786:174-803(+)
MGSGGDRREGQSGGGRLRSDVGERPKQPGGQQRRTGLLPRRGRVHAGRPPRKGTGEVGGPQRHQAAKSSLELPRRNGGRRRQQQQRRRRTPKHDEPPKRSCVQRRHASRRSRRPHRLDASPRTGDSTRPASEIRQRCHLHIDGADSDRRQSLQTHAGVVQERDHGRIPIAGREYSFQYGNDRDTEKGGTSGRLRTRQEAAFPPRVSNRR